MIGICFGGYCPLHRGHLEAIMKAKKQCDKAFVIVCGYDDEPRGKELGLDLNKRYKLINQFFKNDEQIIVLKVNDTKLGLDESMSLSNWRVWSSEVMRQVTENMTDAELFDDVMFYVGEEKYLNSLNKLGYKTTFVPRENGISGTLLRESGLNYFNYITKIFQPYFVKNILIIGTASEGKTTLVNDISKYFNIPKTVEYGRIYMEEKNITDVDLVGNDFHQFISGQYEEYKKAVLNSTCGVTIQDTDNLVTLMYAKAYVDDEAIDFNKDDYEALRQHALSIQKYFNWDHVFVLTPANEVFVDDGTRYMKQASMEERQKNMDILQGLIEEFNYPKDKITYLKGGEFETNFEIVKNYISKLL